MASAAFAIARALGASFLQHRLRELVMSNVEDTWPAPRYNVGKPKHLHAIGVMSMNYNAFERNLYSLYRFHLDRKKIPEKLVRRQRS
jgi:hypothetical protein